MIHLVCGPIGAGKTTYARRIAEECDAIRFSEDEWLSKLFVVDAPEGLLNEPMDIVSAWASERYQRCRAQIWLVCQQLLAQKTSIVLDGAAANKEQRDMLRKKATENNVSFQLHYVTSDPETRRKRVFARNIEQGDTYSLKVTPAIFSHIENYFQPPEGNELEAAVIVET